MYAIIRHYQNEAPEVLELLKQREEGIKEVMRGADGLVGYYLIDTQDGLAGVRIFEDRASAEQSTRSRASWMAENVTEWTPKPSTVIQG